jgi:predicted transcriptional regulator of viral defense system
MWSWSILANDDGLCYFPQEATKAMASARDYFNNLSAGGRHHFTMADAMAALGGSMVAVRAALRRAGQRGEIASPHRGFFVIVPPEYRRLRCLPPEQFIPQLMSHLGEPYYVALLSAAELHGAAHHRPQRFQVMIHKNRRPIECGEARVQFVARHDLEHTPVVEQNTPRGRLRVSSPEATALELVGYADQCGGLDNVASVLSDLVESLNAEKLLEAARLCPVVWSQRLGYLLEMTDHTELASVLADHVRTQGATLAPLVRAKPMKGAPRAERWKLAVNASVESDL